MNSPTPTVARIAVAAPLDKLLSYRIPEELRGVLQVGQRVLAPLGRRRTVGYVFALVDEPIDGLKAVSELLDAQPLFDSALAAFYAQAARYYAYPLGEALRTALPAGLSSDSRPPVILRERLYRPTERGDEPRGPRQRELLAFVRDRGTASLPELREVFPAPHAPLQRLVAEGYLNVTESERPRDPLAGTAIQPHVAIGLNPAQEQALTTIEAALESHAFKPFLLHGVTGSGKTEVYLRAIAKTLKQGRQALLLVPEIGLTPQLVARFRSWFQGQPVRLTIFHSGLSDGER